MDNNNPALNGLTKYPRLVPNSKYPDTSMIERDAESLQKLIFTWQKFNFYNVVNPVDMFNILLRTEPAKRNYYEVIKEGYQKLHFDIDMKVNEMARPTLEYAEMVKDYVIKGIVEYFRENVTEEFFINRDVMLFRTIDDEEEKTKYSYHIVIDTFAYQSSKHCAEVTKKVIAKVPNEMRKYIDTSVNKRNQQFRMVACCKEREEKSRYKQMLGVWEYFGEKIEWRPRIDERWTQTTDNQYLVYERSLVGYFGYKPIKVEFEITGLKYTEWKPPVLRVTEAKKYVPEGWIVKEVFENSFNIEPQETAECLLCKRVHDKGTQWVEIKGGNEEVTFYCEESKDQKQILGILNQEYVPSDVEEKEVEKLVPEGWKITSKHERNYGLRPIDREQTECLLCKRVHEHENQWITVCGPKQNVFFKCRRADMDGISKKCIYLGTLKPNAEVGEDDRLRSVEYKYNKPQIVTNDYYNSPYVNPIEPNPGTILLICSYMGTGKTTAFNNYIRRTNPKRVLVLSSRILYTESITSEYNKPGGEYLAEFTGKKFKTYLEMTENGKRIDYKKSDRLVMQMESLHRLVDVEMYDVLVLDECESLLKQFGSGTMSEQIMCSYVFEELVRRTPIVIGGDAFLSEKSRQTLEKINKNVHIVRNDYKPEKRNAYLYPSIEALYYKAFHSMAIGKKIVFVCAAKEKAMKFAKMCDERNIKYKIYVSESNNIEAERRELRNVNISWTGDQVQCVIYTSKITVGVNYDVKDEFDQLFVYGSSYSCCVRDTFQGTLRVRHIKDKEMYAYINRNPVRKDLPLNDKDIIKYIEKIVEGKISLTREYKPSLLTFVEYETESTVRPIVTHKDTLQEAITKAQCKVVDTKPNARRIKVEYMAASIWQHAPEWLKVCLIHDIKENNISKVCYGDEFENYLVKCSYRIYKIKPEENEVVDLLSDIENKIKYTDIPDLVESQIKEIKTKSRIGIATQNECLMLEKYRYNRMIKDDLPNERKEAVFNKFFLNDKHKRRHFYNIYNEKFRTPEEIAEKESKHKYVETPTTYAEKFKLIRNLNGIFGIGNSTIGFVTLPETVLMNISNISMHIPAMEILFNARSTCKDILNNMINRLDKVYNNWSGTNINKESKQVRYGNLRKYEYTIVKTGDDSVDNVIRKKNPKNVEPIVSYESEPTQIEFISNEINTSIYFNNDSIEKLNAYMKTIDEKQIVRVNEEVKVKKHETLNGIPDYKNEVYVSFKC